MMKTTFVTAKIDVKSGFADTWLQATLENLPRVRAEKGCIRYDLHQAADNTESFLFYEIWTDSDALQQHTNSEHMKAYHEATAHCIKSASVQPWQAVVVVP